MDEEIKICPECGSGDIGKGVLQHEAQLQPINKPFSTGSKILVDVCASCGKVISMKVKDPYKFK